ncbi:hypothetical protein [Pararhodobacter sp.]|uniref:hypothetical protein n=1 Tax=Pararhodobacter sp. TaxID=2127056 RepID=UPI002AFF6966|nr:hypothetical protein [Pararhodobacter sp.]
MTAITERDFRAHLAWSQNPEIRGCWKPGDDLTLAEALATGRGLAVAAATLGRSEAACRHRWDQLYPEAVRGIRFQEVLLATLRERAGGRA